VKIPWSKLSSDPSAWITPECFPPDFQWADPSKIRVGQVFRLLDHWRQRQKSGLAPLIWNPSCELLTDVDQLSQQVRNQRSTHTDHSVSDEREGRDGFSSEDEEENFADELDKISNERSVSSSSSSPSPAPSPHLKQSRIHSCVYFLSFCDLC
jgi:hypothetical protein